MSNMTVLCGLLISVAIALFLLRARRRPRIFPDTAEPSAELMLQEPDQHPILTPLHVWYRESLAALGELDDKLSAAETEFTEQLAPYAKAVEQRGELLSALRRAFDQDTDEAVQNLKETYLRTHADSYHRFEKATEALCSARNRVQRLAEEVFDQYGVKHLTERDSFSMRNWPIYRDLTPGVIDYRDYSPALANRLIWQAYRRQLGPHERRREATIEPVHEAYVEAKNAACPELRTDVQKASEEVGQANAEFAAAQDRLREAYKSSFDAAVQQCGEKLKTAEQKLAAALALVLPVEEMGPPAALHK